MRAVAAAVLTSVMLACGLPGTGLPSRRVIALVDGQPVYLSDLEQYLEANLLGEGLQGQQADLDRVKSRLLDALIDERLQLAEAERRGIAVSDLEIESRLSPEGAEALSPANRLLARRLVMVEKLEQQVAEELEPIDDSDVLAHLKRDRTDGRGGGRLLLRALMLESAEEAERVYRSVRDRQMTFDEAVAAYKTNPGQGVPVEVAYDGLPDELRAVLGDVKSGELVGPLEVQGEHYLFRVDSWLDDPTEGDETRMARARQELEALRLQWASAALLQELRQKARITLRRRNLPFRYVSEAS